MEIPMWVWVCVLFNVRLAGCLDVHLPEALPPGTLVANLSLGPGWTYKIDRTLSPKFIQNFFQVEWQNGVIRLSQRVQCARTLRNPAPVYFRTGSLTSGDVILTHFNVFVHGQDCFIKYKRKNTSGKPDVHIHHLSQLGATSCLPAGKLLLNVTELLPAFTRNVALLDTLCSGKDVSAAFTHGGLFLLSDLCLEHGGGQPEVSLQCALHSSPSGRLSVRVSVRLEQRGSVQRKPGTSIHRGKRNANMPPQFQLPTYQVSVPENEPAGTRVITLKATDPDDGEAGRLEYAMEALFDSRSNDFFIINSQTGSITTVQPLDREVKDTHVFKVMVTDNGTPKRSAISYFTVTVSDTNDHGPVFEQTEYRVSIRENVEVGFEVMTIRATDGDAPSNANMIYKIVNGDGVNSVFEIDPRNGLVRIRERPDRETRSQYQLIVEANDQGKDPGPRSATATVHISVEDENDNYPQFSEKRYVVQIPENVAVNTKVIQVEATDKDEGNNAKVHYSIISGNVKGQFYIHSPTGVIDVINPLDYEMIREYNLRIKAQDGGRPPLINGTGMVVVQVVDVNDNAPMFVSTPFQATVLENVAIGYSVIHIQAIDADSAENAHLEYRLTDTAPGFPFTVNNSTGWITVSAELDRETTEFYTFGVEARDHGIPVMSSSASVSITVLDVNDNVPTFTEKVYSLKINEDAVVGTSVLTMTAVDRDVNSVVTYQISSGNTRNRFAITSQSGGGLITLALPLDYKQERQYVLTVTASDGTRYDTAQVFINVTDANTHRPVFQSANYQVMISEDRPVGSTVVVISATDEDTGENARITYVMEDNVPQFKIEPDTGAITTQMEIDYEDQASYTLAIIARDNGIPQKSDTTYVEIIILDANDNAPQFLRDMYQGTVSEEVPVYTSVLQISASDRDSGSNGRLSYTFQGGDDGEGDFHIEPYSGIIRTARKLDRENVPVYNLKAFAVDKGVPPLKAAVVIHISVQDINDNAPVFEKDELFIDVEENSPVGSIVARISATDPDEGTNAQIMYQIMEGNIPEVFQLDIFTGDLTALTDLDYEARTEYVIVVQATSAPLVSRATVHIRLVDVNDNMPVLQNFEIIFNNYITNKSNSFPSGIIGKVPAHDPDVSDKLHYKFESGNQLSLLLLNEDTGELKLSRDLDNNRALEASMTISVSETEDRSLDLTGPLLLGGVPNLPEDFPVRNRDFVGCMRNLSIDSKPTDMASFIANNGTTAGCPAKKNFCTQDVCQNGGVCLNKWNTYGCDCPTGYGGKSCEQVMPSPQFFDGQAVVSWSELDVTIAVPWYMGLMFRTRQPAGTLMQANAGRSSTVSLMVSEQLVRMEVLLKKQLVASLVFPQVRVNDGEWHHLLVELSSVKDGKDIKYMAAMSLDYGMYQKSVEIGNDLPGLKLRALYVGGLPGEGNHVNKGFTGCIQGVRMGETSTNVANVNMAQGLKIRVEEGCDLADPCDSNICPENSHCSDDWSTHTCICDPGYFGKECLDACQLNPCEHVSTCIRKPSSSHGYTCECGQSYYGQYCENKVEKPCPRGWWGSPMCGPCNCDISRGFDPDCNKTTGECRCKNNYYRPEGDDTCYPCECFSEGSESRTCDPHTGQCPCKGGVIGRQCNRCDNPFAEVTSTGCEVVYEGCPKAFDAGIWWPNTKCGRPAAMNCPKGSVGTAVRHCSDDKGWLPPELFNCTTVTFSHLKKLNEDLRRNDSRMDSERSKAIVRLLHSATNNTKRFYGNDVKTAAQLLSRVLQYESRQAGFDLTAMQDAEFNEHLVRAGSAILDPGTKEHWEKIQRTEGGTAHLLRSFEDYANTLAQNVRKTYLKPFTIVTDNMIVTVDYLDVSDPEKATFPRFQEIQESFPKELRSSVHFPEFNLRPQEHRVEPSPAPSAQTDPPEEEEEEHTMSNRKRRHAEPAAPLPVAMVIVYKSLGQLLPERYDPDRRSLRLPNRPVINTAIVSAAMHSEGPPLPLTLDPPITLEFTLLETEERSKPVCVFWNHSIAIGGTGGWSSKGCELLNRNNSHISCQCNHMTSFAVLMDVSKREHGDVLPVKIVTYTTVSVSLFLLLLTFILLCLLHRLRSNLHAIHRNLVAALFFSELVFLLGINQTDNPFVCTVIAILLHYFYMCTFAWMFVEGLHIYRMLTELRNINHGHMRFYYAMGWGIPAIITGLAVGLDPQGYGNPDFCWLSVHDTLIWSFAGPIFVVVLVNIIIFALAAKASCGRRQKAFEKSGAIPALRMAFLLLLLICATWLLGLMAVNSDVMTFHYLFAIFSCLQGVFIFFCHVIFNKEVRKNLKNVFTGKKSLPDESSTTRASLLTKEA
ncbi:cadherin EGF LAG seven-pass G-type receptor 1 [Diretmus argenteus]